ncbi:hypothetical protein WA026_014182 [Henosepilachna vigintioctopunctata]|uniref:Uncharacterized protein n=1 Tax=Henosepilachna vigintioctopunctata TaxID=420089 RepID=A0AAW1TLW9_9CUCU
MIMKIIEVKDPGVHTPVNHKSPSGWWFLQWKKPMKHYEHLSGKYNFNDNGGQQKSKDKDWRKEVVVLRKPFTQQVLLRIDQLSIEKALQFYRTSVQIKNLIRKFEEKEQEGNFAENIKNLHKSKNNGGKCEENNYRQNYGDNNDII